ncbi:MAG: four helix bundle protein [candidate division WOR-3 bacterium]|nr:four helix bundle protein [candidate division WOR-3 bacterium]
MPDIWKYDVFKLADRLVLDVYRLTSHFPDDERFGLTAQMRRAAYSIPMNLVEGASRGSTKDFNRFVLMANGSCDEIRYQLHLACQLGYIDQRAHLELAREYEKVRMMLTKLSASLRRRATVAE